MAAYQFRFANRSHPFSGARPGAAFAARKPRHRLLRIVLGLLGLGVVLALVFFSVFVGLAMLTVGVLARLWRVRGKPIVRDPRIVDGDFRVIAKSALPRA